MIAIDWVTLIAAGLAFIASILTLILTLSSQKKTRYINTVTSSRILWIDNLRETVSEFISLLPEDTKKQEKHQSDKQPLLEKLSKSKTKIILYLNPNGEIDNEILNLVDDLYLYSRYYHASIDCLVQFKSGSKNYGDTIFDYYLSVLTKDSFTEIARKYYDINKIKKFHSSFSPDLSVDEIDSLLKKITDYLIDAGTTPELINQEIITYIKDKSQLLSNTVSVYLKNEWQRVKEESKIAFRAKSN